MSGLALALALVPSCGLNAEASPASSTTLTTRSSRGADLELAEVDFGDLSEASDPILRALSDGERSGWRLSDEQPGLAGRARDLLEDPSGPNLEVAGQPMSRTHPSGGVAVQYEVVQDGRRMVTTVLFAPPET